MSYDPSYLANYQAVIDAYGYWPSFHDSPVLRFVEDRDSIEMELEAWETTSETDERGYFKRIKQHVIGFSFTGIVSREIGEVAHDNILFSLSLSSNEERESLGHFTVDLDSAIADERCGSFCAREGVVTCIRSVEES